MNLGFLTYLAENTVIGTSVDISKSAKLLIFHLNQFVCSMSECVLLFQSVFTSTNVKGLTVRSFSKYYFKVNPRQR